MKRAEPYSFGSLADGLDHAVLHFTGGFVGEGKSQDAFSRKTQVRFQQIANAFGDYARFSGSGARHNEQRSVAMLHRGVLLIV